MSACEKCWADAGGDMERYAQLLKERADNPCTPEQQAGDPTPWCLGCGAMKRENCDCGPIAANN